MTECSCLRPPFNYQDFDSKEIGIDETNGRYGSVTIETCKKCGANWLRYLVEYEAFSKSGRWDRGLIWPERATVIKPETALAELESLDWYFAGGSYFDSTGFKTSGPPAADP